MSIPASTPKPWLSDSDLTVYLGDALEVLREMDAGSVDCCVTSPPYFGLRDYGTERQIGLEPTVVEYVASLVAVFAEVRRVLSSTATLWLNLGDSYASDPAKGGSGTPNGRNNRGEEYGRASRPRGGLQGGTKTVDVSLGGACSPGLKPKDLMGVPWRVAFALQADGWYLRSDIIWSKPNPMPESVTDRPTKAHEYVFLLSKSARYWFDQDAVREMYAPASEDRYRYAFGGPKNEALSEANKNGVGVRTRPIGMRQYGGAKGPDGRHNTHVEGADGSLQHRDGERWPNGGRNIRSVWEIPTQPYPEAHFAVFPEELPRRCILAGCPEWVCGTCGKARERILEHKGEWRAEHERPAKHNGEIYRTNPGGGIAGPNTSRSTTLLGWSDCGHDNYRPGTVLDPFGGSGTTALVARKHRRRSILIELNEDYCELAKKRMATWWKPAARTREVVLEGQGDLFSH